MGVPPMWPTDNPWPAFAVCLLAAVALFMMWSQQRQMKWMFGTIICLILAAASLATDAMVVTPREQVVQNIYAITQAFQKRDLDKTLSFISKSSWDVQLLAAEGYNLVKVHDDMRVTDVQVEMIAKNQRARSRFRVNATLDNPVGTSRVSTMWDAKWQSEPDGWKMIEITALDPITGEPQGFLEAHRDRVRRLYPK